MYFLCSIDNGQYYGGGENNGMELSVSGGEFKGILDMTLPEVSS